MGNDKTTKPKHLGLVEPDDAVDPGVVEQNIVVDQETLDAEEAEYAAMRVDVPGSEGAAAVGIVVIGVAKTPGRHEFYRTNPDFRPSVFVAVLEEGMERQVFVVTKAMKPVLESIGIGVAKHTLYLTVTSRGSVKIIPVRDADGDEPNEYSRTKEVGLVQGIREWVRLYVDRPNQAYRVYPAPADRFPEPQWPLLKHARIFKLAFKDRGHLIDSPEHPAFKRWAARDRRD